MCISQEILHKIDFFLVLLTNLGARTIARHPVEEGLKLMRVFLIRKCVLQYLDIAVEGDGGEFNLKIKVRSTHRNVCFIVKDVSLVNGLDFCGMFQLS